jgi:hypothetical protein
MVRTVPRDQEQHVPRRRTGGEHGDPAPHRGLALGWRHQDQVSLFHILGHAVFLLLELLLHKDTSRRGPEMQLKARIKGSFMQQDRLKESTKGKILIEKKLALKKYFFQL